MNRLFALVLFFTVDLFADGPALDEHGRFVGDVVVLHLSKGQIDLLSERKKEYIYGGIIELSDLQKERLSKVAGFSPSELNVSETRLGIVGCTCNAANEAFRFTKEKIEVPLKYLVRDESKKGTETKER